MAPLGFMLNYLGSRQSDMKEAQLANLRSIMATNKATEFGKAHQFNRITRLEHLKHYVPIHNYEDIKPLIERMKNGESDVLLKGVIQNYAVSAGTTGEGKHMPLSKERIASDQRFMRMVSLSYLAQRPNIFPFLGTHVSLPGGIETNEDYPDIKMGEISGYLAKHSPKWLSIFQVRSPEQMINESFEVKFEHAIAEAIENDVRQITAIPSWMLKFFQQALERTGKKSIKEIWPNLRLLICGGESLTTYKPHFQKLCDGLELDFIENYGASEGYFAFSDDLESEDLKLVTDNGLFYEWIPEPADVDDLKSAETVPTWEVKPGIPYAMVITNNSGLYRYILNDLIEFTDVDNPRIKVLGRLNDMLDQFGEALEGWEAEEALSKVAKNHNADYSIFTIGAALDGKDSLPQHHWFIQWVHAPNDAESFKKELDQKLKEINRHYNNRRNSEAIGEPRLYSLNKDILEKWKVEYFNLGAQTKTPKMITSDDKLQALRDLCSDKELL